MWSIILNWLQINYPIILWALIVASITWLIASFYYRRFKKTEDLVKSLPCSARGDMFKSISEDLLQIKTYLMTKNPTAAAAFSMKASPRKLNSAGEELYNDINGKEFLSKNQSFFLQCIEEKKPTTALDVERCAAEVLLENLNESIFNSLKNWVYNSSARKVVINEEEKEYTITMSDICFVLSLPLRDTYLNLHPELLA